MYTKALILLLLTSLGLAAPAPAPALAPREWAICDKERPCPAGFRCNSVPVWPPVPGACMPIVTDFCERDGDKVRYCPEGKTCLGGDEEGLCKIPEGQGGCYSVCL